MRLTKGRCGSNVIRTWSRVLSVWHNCTLSFLYPPRARDLHTRTRQLGAFLQQLFGRARGELRLLAAREAGPDGAHHLRLRPASVPAAGQVVAYLRSGHRLHLDAHGRCPWDDPPPEPAAPDLTLHVLRCRVESVRLFAAPDPQAGGSGGGGLACVKLRAEADGAFGGAAWHVTVHGASRLADFLVDWAALEAACRRPVAVGEPVRTLALGGGVRGGGGGW